MDFNQFIRAIKSTIPPETILQNPGGGTTTIIAYDNEYLKYRRGKSRFKVGLNDLFEAYSRFRGTQLSSRELKQINPRVFDSKFPHFGHSCNATLLYMFLKEIGVVEGVHGAGHRGNPFFVDIPSS